MVHYSFACIGLIFKNKPCFMCHQVHMCNKHLCTFVVYIIYTKTFGMKWPLFEITIHFFRYLISQHFHISFLSIEYQFINFILASIRISKADPAPTRRDRAPLFLNSWIHHRIFLFLQQHLDVLPEN